MEDKPNVLLLHADDMSPFMSPWVKSTHPMANKTPNLNRLVENGVSFTTTLAQQPVCGPSRSSIFSGRYPQSTKVFNFDRYLLQVSERLETIPKYFKNEMGYHTAVFGKVFHPFLVGDVLNSKDAYYAADHTSQPAKAFNHNGNGECASRMLYCEVNDQELTDEAIANSAIKYMKQRAKEDAERLSEGKGRQPWLAIVGFRRPHTAFASPSWTYEAIPLQSVIENDAFVRDQPKIANVDNFRYSLTYFECRKMDERVVEMSTEGKFEAVGRVEDLVENTFATAHIRRAYYASIHWMDYQLGRVLDGLETYDYKHNTIVVFFSDHGWLNGEHGMFCKSVLASHGVTVPLIVSYPWMESEPQNQVSHSPAQLVDIFPTLIDLVNGPEFDDGTGIGLDGVSLVPALEAPTEIFHHAAAYSQYPRCICNSNRQADNSVKPCPGSSDYSLDVEKGWIRAPGTIQFHPCSTAQDTYDRAGSCDRPEIVWMGYTIRTERYKYVEWRPFNEKQTVCEKMKYPIYNAKGKVKTKLVSPWETQQIDPDETVTDWTSGIVIEQELYDMKDSTGFGDWEQTNLAYNPTSKDEQIMTDLSRMIREQFDPALRYAKTCNDLGIITNYGTPNQKCVCIKGHEGKDCTFRVPPTPAPTLNLYQISYETKDMKNSNKVCTSKVASGIAQCRDREPVFSESIKVSGTGLGIFDVCGRKCLKESNCYMYTFTKANKKRTYRCKGWDCNDATVNSLAFEYLDKGHKSNRFVILNDSCIETLITQIGIASSSETRHLQSLENTLPTTFVFTFIVIGWCLQIVRSLVMRHRKQLGLPTGN